MSVLSLRKAVATAPPPPSPPSPERVKLAETIAALREAEGNHAALVAASDYGGPAEMAERTAQDALERAQALLEQAKANAVTALVGGTDLAGTTIKEARAAIQAAEDDIATAVTARQTIRESIEPAQNRVASLQLALERHSNAVIRTEASIATLLKDIDTLGRQLIDKGKALDWLLDTDRVPRYGPAADPSASWVHSLLTQPANQWTHWRAPGASPSADAWQAALERLKTDATAPLPAVTA
jgi:hypothetical protein